MPRVETLREFYAAMHASIGPRRAVTAELVAGRRPDPADVDELRGLRAALLALPEDGAGRRLERSDGRSIHVDLAYELGELEKDLAYLDDGDAAIDDLLRARLAVADAERDELVGALGDLRPHVLVTDRDGTVNGYCGRYASSVQSIWNAVALTRYAASRADHAIVLTSAPLDDVGIADLTVSPPGAFTVAGSKGREYVDPTGARRRFPIADDDRERLDELNRRLDELLARPDRRILTLIGSGRQHKFGQTTVAYQDVTESVPDDVAAAFRDEVRALVAAVDPAGDHLRVEDTGLDLELLLTVDEVRAGESRDFDKGDGLRFLADDLHLDLGAGPALVCGDTASDEPMMRVAAELAPEVRTVYVTADEGRRAEVAAALPGTSFASEPDVLVTALRDLAAG